MGVVLYVVVPLVVMALTWFVASESRGRRERRRHHEEIKAVYALIARPGSVYATALDRAKADDWGRRRWVS